MLVGLSFAAGIRDLRPSLNSFRAGVAALLAAGLLGLPSQRFNLFGRKALPVFSEARARDHVRSTITYLTVLVGHFEIESLCISRDTPSLHISAGRNGCGRRNIRCWCRSEGRLRTLLGCAASDNHRRRQAEGAKHQIRYDCKPLF